MDTRIKRKAAACIVVAAVTLTLAGCGGDTAAPPASVASQTTAPVKAAPSAAEEHTTAPTVEQMTEATTAPTPDPDPVVIDATSTVVVDCSGSGVTISTVEIADGRERLREVYRYTLSNVDDLRVTIANCSARGTFNQDFSGLLAEGSTPSGDGQHVVYVDLARGQAHDLSASEVGSGFSGGAPVREIAVFETMPDTMTFTGRIVVSSDDYSSARVHDPSDLQSPEPYDEGYILARDVERPAGIDYDDSHARTVLSPDGALVVSEGLGKAPRAARAVESGTSQDFYQCGSRPEGWISDRAIVMSGADEGEFVVATFNDEAVLVDCTSILPDADREIVDGRLRLDATVLYVAVSGAQGIEWYEADPGEPGAEPAPVDAPATIDPDLRIYHRRG